MTRGRHADSASGGFYRDLAMMILGILLVGAAVFFLLYFVVGDGSNSAASSTSSSASTATTSLPATTTTSQAPTSTSTLATTTSTEEVTARSPGEVRVTVLNSIRVAGAAGRFTEVLADAGYQTLQPGDLDQQQDPSRIWYRPGFSLEASEFLEFIPTAVVEPIPDPELEPGADIVVVLGTGYEE